MNGRAWLDDRLGRNLGDDSPGEAGDREPFRRHGVGAGVFEHRIDFGRHDEALVILWGEGTRKR